MCRAQRSSWLCLSSQLICCAVAVGLLIALLAPAVAAQESAKPIDVKLSHALRSQTSHVLQQIGKLAGGGRQGFRLRLSRPESLDLRVHFASAPFNGTQANVQINGKRLLPYFAFGGDTRYDNVKGKVGMRPPVARIEGRWLIPASLLYKGRNELILWTTGVVQNEALERIGPRPTILVDAVRIGPANGADLPDYANSVYFDFNIWPQGYPWGSRRHFDDLALLGVINGEGMPAIIPPLGKGESALWDVKRACEDRALGWGIGHQEFYTIWEFCGNPDLWAKYVDVDNNPETESKFHRQTIYPHVQSRDVNARGADIVLYDVKKYGSSGGSVLWVERVWTC